MTSLCPDPAVPLLNGEKRTRVSNRNKNRFSEAFKAVVLPASSVTGCEVGSNPWFLAVSGQEGGDTTPCPADLCAAPGEASMPYTEVLCNSINQQ